MAELNAPPIRFNGGYSTAPGGRGHLYASAGKTWSWAITSQESPTSLRIEPFNHGLSTSSALAQDTYWPGISSNASTRPERTPWNSGSIDPCTHGPLHNTIPAGPM